MSSLVWNPICETKYRRSDDKMSVILIHLTAGWRWCIYDRVISSYRGADVGYDSPYEAMDIADGIRP